MSCSTRVVWRAAYYQGWCDRRSHEEIELDDKFENMGAQMVREVASKTSDQAKGTAPPTATILAHAIVREGAKKGVAAGMNPMDLKPRR